MRCLKRGAAVAIFLLALVAVTVFDAGCNPIPFLMGKAADQADVAAAAETKSLRERYPDLMPTDRLDTATEKIVAAETQRLAAELKEAKSLAEAEEMAKRAAQNTAAGVGSAALAALLSAFSLWARGTRWKGAFLTVTRTIESAATAGPAAQGAACLVKDLVAKAAPPTTTVGGFIAKAIQAYVQGRA